MAITGKKSKNVILRKVMDGLTLTCFVVFILGQVSQGVSAKSMLIWSSIMTFALLIISRVLIKVWSSWEDISDRPQAKRTK